MYCKTCGESNPDWSNYCSHDGTTLVSSQSLKQLQLLNRENNFCPNCGDEKKKSDIYCNSCGHSLLRFNKSTNDVKPSLLTSTKPVRFGTFSITELSIKKILTNALLPTIASFILMLVLNYISFSTINNFYEDVFKEAYDSSPIGLAEDFAGEMGTSIKKPGKLFGFTDNVMLSNVISPNYEAQMENNLDYGSHKWTGELHISFSYILFILFPIFSLFVGGIIYRKINQTESIRTLLFGAIGIGLIYCILLSIFSIFSGFHYNLQMEGIKLNIDTSYSIFATLIKGFLIGTVFSLLGMLFSINFRQITKHLENLIPYGNAVHQGFAAFSRGFITLSIIMIVTLVSKINEWKSQLEWMDVPGLNKLLEKTAWFSTYMGIQLSSVIYSMLHFSPLSFKLDTNEESGGVTYSIFSGFTYSGAAQNEDTLSLEYFFGLYDIDLYLKLAMLIPIILLLWAGHQLAQSHQVSYKSLAILSLVYSLFTASLAAASGIHIEGLMGATDEGTTSFNFSLATSTFRVFIGSFILSYIIGFIGSYLTKFLPNNHK